MEPSDPIPRIMRRRGGSRYRTRGNNNVQERVKTTLAAKGRSGGKKKYGRNAVKNRDKARLKREANNY